MSSERKAEEGRASKAEQDAPQDVPSTEAMWAVESDAEAQNELLEVRVSADPRKQRAAHTEYDGDVGE